MSGGADISQISIEELEALASKIGSTRDEISSRLSNMSQVATRFHDGVTKFGSQAREAEKVSEVLKRMQTNLNEITTQYMDLLNQLNQRRQEKDREQANKLNQGNDNMRGKGSGSGGGGGSPQAGGKKPSSASPSMSTPMRAASPGISRTPSYSAPSRYSSPSRGPSYSPSSNYKAGTPGLGSSNYTSPAPSSYSPGSYGGSLGSSPMGSNGYSDMSSLNSGSDMTTESTGDVPFFSEGSLSDESPADFSAGNLDANVGALDSGLDLSLIHI